MDFFKIVVDGAYPIPAVVSKIGGSRGAVYSESTLNSGLYTGANSAQSFIAAYRLAQKLVPGKTAVTAFIGAEQVVLEVVGGGGFGGRHSRTI
jgi:hypothetical protein